MKTHSDGLLRDRVVVFIDILGFAELVKASATDDSGAAFNKIEAGLKRIQELSSPAHEPQINGLEVQVFSDSVIMSAPAEKSSVSQLFQSLSRLVWDLMKLGIWVRGGISFGKISPDPSRPWGPAVIEAYRVENTIAQYPRIALGKSAVNLAKKLDMLGRLGRISRDHDGVYSIDSINFILGLVLFEHEHAPSEEDLLEIKSRLDEAHSEVVDNPSVFSKIEWLCNQWDNNFEPHDSPFDRSLRTESGKGASLADKFDAQFD